MVLRRSHGGDVGGLCRLVSARLLLLLFECSCFYLPPTCLLAYLPTCLLVYAYLSTCLPAYLPAHCLPDGLRSPSSH